jgi:hypothetical protein
VARSARLLSRVYGLRAVIFGHTHDASGRFEDGVFFGNSGTWVPRHHDVACSIIVEDSRPLIWLREESAALHGGLFRFHDGCLHEDSVIPQAAPADTPAANGSTTVPSRTRSLRAAAYKESAHKKDDFFA